MRKALLTATLCLLVPAAGARPVSKQDNMPSSNLAITHVSVIPMDRPGVLRDQTILIANMHIIAMAKRLAVPPGVRIIEGHHRYVIPGLWDMHVHVLAASSSQRSESMLRTLLAGGVTGVRDMGSTMAQLQQFKAARLAGDGPFPDLIGAGPVINGPATRWSRPIEAHVGNPDEGRRVVESQLAAGSDFIKPYSGLDPASYQAVAAQAHNSGVALGGHLPLSIDLQTALAAGQRSIEHMEVHLSKSCGSEAPAKAASEWIAAYTQSLAKRDEVELVLRKGRDLSRCQALLRQMAQAPVWWTPTLMLDFADASFVDDDFVRAAGADGAAACRASPAATTDVTSADLRRRALQGELDDVAAAHRAGVKILAGTDMPTPCEAPLASLRQELSLLHRAGLTPFEALQTATLEPARYLGRADAGAVEAGKIADLVLLDQNPLADLNALKSVSGVVLHGAVVADSGAGSE